MDRRVVYYDPARLQRARSEIFVHMTRGPNLAIITPRQALEGGGATIFDAIIGHKTFSAYNRNYVMPLYAYPNDPAELGLSGQGRTLNLDPTIYAAICAAAGLTPSPDAGEGDAFRIATGDARPAEVKVFDYIYGVLHAPAYRERYAEFLRIDFPRVPYPRDADTFARLSDAGEALRRLHLMEPAAIGDATYPFTGDGDDVVASGYPKYEGGRVLINPVQGFDGVPAVAWDHPIGGYLPARKWLKDRRGRALSWEDVTHYQRVVRILAETDRIMRTIDLPLDADPG
jgi:hypothetical protein